MTSCALYTATRDLAAPLAEVPCTPRHPFLLSRHIGAVALSFGASWSLAFNMAPTLGFVTTQTNMSVTALTLLVYAVYQVAVLLLSWAAGIEDASFSLMLRWVIAIIAACWSLMPAFVMTSPEIGYLISVILFLMESVVVGLFTIESAWESGQALSLVFARFAATFVAGACLASAAFWIIESLSAATIAPALISSLAVTATVAILPMLPSRSSTAVTFTMKRLPEDETVNEKVEQAKTRLVGRC